MRVVVYHSYYGCDTGCCGHVVAVGDKEKFYFDHPYGEDPRTFAEALVRQECGEAHVADLVWDECEIYDD